jgi:hypothetical protein
MIIEVRQYGQRMIAEPSPFVFIGAEQLGQFKLWGMVNSYDQQLILYHFSKLSCQVGVN